MGRVGNALVVRLDLDTGGIHGIGADVGEGVEALALELATKRCHLEGQRSREDHLVVLGNTGNLVHLCREVGISSPHVGLGADNLTATSLERRCEGIRVHTGIGDPLTLGEHDRTGDSLVQRPLRCRPRHAEVVEGHKVRVDRRISEGGLGGRSHEQRHLATGDLQDRQSEVGKGWTDDELCPPVEQLLGGKTGVVTNLGHTNLDRAAIDSAAAVDQLGNVGHQVRTRNVDEPDDITEVHRHAHTNRITRRHSSTTGQVSPQNRINIQTHRRRNPDSTVVFGRSGGGRSGGGGRRSSGGRSGGGGRRSSGGRRSPVIAASTGCGHEAENRQQRDQGSGLHVMPLRRNLASGPRTPTFGALPDSNVVRVQMIEAPYVCMQILGMCPLTGG